MITPIMTGQASCRLRTLAAAAGTAAAAAATRGRRRLHRTCATPAAERHGREQLHGVGVALRALCRIAGGGHRPVDLEGVATGATAELVARHVCPSGGGTGAPAPSVQLFGVTVLSVFRVVTRPASWPRLMPCHPR